MQSETLKLAIIVPLLNEKAALAGLMNQLQAYQACELIVVDGGSQDGSWQWLCDYQRQFSVKLIQSESGRAKQMNAGVELADSEFVLFLHADTSLPADFLHSIIQAKHNGLLWGRFDVQFKEQGKHPIMAVIAWFINARSRLSAIATGDQAIFVRREVFNRLGGFAQIPIMEDIELCKRLKTVSRPFCSELKVQTSARRWLQKGIVKTVCLMWVMRFAYFIGVPPKKLATWYANVR